MPFHDDEPPTPKHAYANFNTWEDKSAAQWWAEARAAKTVEHRDEAIAMAHYLQECDDLTNRFENLPIVQRFRAAQAAGHQP